MLQLRYNEPVFILMLRRRVGCLRIFTALINAWKVVVIPRSTYFISVGVHRGSGL